MHTHVFIVLAFSCTAIAGFATGGCEKKPATSNPNDASRPAPAQAPNYGPKPAANASESNFTLQSVPRYNPATVAECEKTSSLKSLMAHRFNPAMSQISLAIYRMPPQEAGPVVVEATSELLGCSSDLVEHLRRKVASEDWPATDLAAVNMQFNVFAMQAAATEGDMNQVVHWYLHLKQSCAGCHARMWPDR